MFLDRKVTSYKQRAYKISMLALFRFPAAWIPARIQSEMAQSCSPFHWWNNSHIHVPTAQKKIVLLLERTHPGMIQQDLKENPG